jgi:glutamyl-tRNA reductase
LIVTNRSVSRARELVADVGFGQAVEMPGLVEALGEVDIAITSTGAANFVLTPERVAAAMAARPARPLVVVDIAVPRDADPQIAQVANVSLVDIDGLRDVVDEKLESRREAIPHVEEIIAEYIERFSQWFRSRSALPVIAALTQKAEAIREAEIERLFSRCPDLTDREKMLVVGMSMTVVSKLLHSVVNKIRAMALSEHGESLALERLLEELFELDLADAIAPLLPHATGRDVDPA